jgi:hypothetical protein
VPFVTAAWSNMRNPRRTTTIGAAVGLSLLSFVAGVYVAVNYGGAPKLEGGVANAVESPEGKGRADNAPKPDSVELSETRSGSVSFPSKRPPWEASTSTKSC